MRMNFASGGRMKTKYWFLIGIILVCVYGAVMWGRQEDVPTTHMQEWKIEGPTAVIEGRHPAATSKWGAAESPASRLKRDVPLASASSALDMNEREELTPSGLPINDPEVLDPEEVEKRILDEQLAESLRNPAYPQATVGANSEDNIEDPADDTEMETSEEFNAELLDADELADDQSEQESEEEVALNDEEVDENHSGGERFFMRPQLTASGVEISEHDYLDPEEAEKRLLAEQLAESLKNPTYLQSNLEEEIIEEESEED